MKIFFSIMLIFLFLSCSGGKKTPESVVPDEDGDQDIDIVDDDDEFIDDGDSDTETKPDKDSDKPDNDDDEDTEIIPDPCETEPCKGIENSTGKCFAYGKHYGCECSDGYLWLGAEKGCVDKKIFRGTVCTGQKKCYDMEKEIPCPKEGEPFFGQDAQYAEMGKCFPRSYTIKQYDNGETVIDNNTGLEWQRQSSLKIYDGSYAGDNCDRMYELGGYGDWKLPTVSDFYSLVDFGTYDPAIDEFYFPDTPSEMFFTNEYYEPAGHEVTNYYEGVDFTNGTTEVIAPGSDSAEKMRFRCVRPSDRQPPYCKNHLFSGDGYEIRNDTLKRLVFKVDPVSGKNWQEALEYCENLTYAGISDWRLPNRNEISDIYFRSAAWSSSSVVSDPKSAWILGYSGNFDSATKSNTVNVYCVASEPCGEKELWTGEKCIPFSAIFLRDDGCSCMDGYGYDYDSGSGECVEQCTDDMCKDAEHSTGRCTNNNVRSYCQCEDNFYYYGEKCENRCEELDSGSDGTVTEITDFGYTCGCKEGYYLGDYNHCRLVDECDYRFPCKNSALGIIWSVGAQRDMKWERAKQYCEELDYLGYTNWRLPNIDELRNSLHVKYSDCIKAGGECKVSENSGCLSQECMQNCKCVADIEEEKYSMYDFIWSSSFRSDAAAQVFVLYSIPGAIISVDPGNTFGQTSCVRDLE